MQFKFYMRAEFTHYALCRLKTKTHILDFMKGEPVNHKKTWFSTWLDWFPADSSPLNQGLPFMSPCWGFWTSAIGLKMKTILWCFCGRIMGIANLDFRSQDLKSLLPTHRRSILIGGFKYFYFQPYLGKWSNLTNMFQRGWNHHLVYCKYLPPPPLTFIYRIPKISKYPC